MALTALIAASDLLDDAVGGPVAGGAGLRALASVGGMTVLERQVDQLLAIGVERLFVAVAALPGELVEAIDRQTRRGVAIGPVRTIAELATALDPDDRVIIVADGLHARQMHYRAVADGPAPTILVTPDTNLTQGLERVDAGARWAGLASLTAGDVADLATLPGEWDLTLTLFRRAVQGGPRRLTCEPALFEQGDIAVVSSAGIVPPLEMRMIAGGQPDAMGMGGSLLFMPIARLAGPWLVGHAGVAATLPGAVLLFLLGHLGAALAGWAAVAAGCAVLAAAALASLRFLASFRTMTGAHGWLVDWGQPVLIALIALFPVAGSLFAADGPLPPTLLLAVAAMLALTLITARAVHGAIGRRRGRGWLLPDAEQIWVMLALAAPFGLVAPALAVAGIGGAAQLAGWLSVTRRRLRRRA